MDYYKNKPIWYDFNEWRDKAIKDLVNDMSGYIEVQLGEQVTDNQPFEKGIAYAKP